MSKRIDNTKCYFLKIHRSAGNVNAFYDRMLAPAGVTARQYSLLYEISRQGSCSISELSRAAELDRTTLTRSLRPLLEAGFIEDRKNAGTRNSVLVLTECGITVCFKAEKLWSEAQEQVERLLGKSRLDEFESVLELLRCL